MSLHDKSTLNYKIWIPHLFFSLETIAVYYPSKPNKMTKKKYYEFINDLPVFFPEKPMGTYFLSLLDKYPVQPYLTSRTSFMKWIFFIKKKMYKTLKIEIFDFYENLEIYYNAYKPKEVIDLEKYKSRKKYGHFTFLVIFGYLIYYFYNR